MNAKKTVMNIGIISFVTMFIILCFSTFAILSLVSANASSKTSEKSVLYKQEYYNLNNEGSDFLKTVDDKLYEIYQNTTSEEQYLSQIGQLQNHIDGIQIDGNVITYRIVEDNQQLTIQVEVVYPSTTLYKIKAWRIESNKEWNPDQGLNIL